MALCGPHFMAYYVVLCLICEIIFIQAREIPDDQQFDGAR
jgi:hypothetical protein